MTLSTKTVKNLVDNSAPEEKTPEKTSTGDPMRKTYTDDEGTWYPATLEDWMEIGLFVSAGAVVWVAIYLIWRV